jgi:hypothetical protein
MPRGTREKQREQTKKERKRQQAEALGPAAAQGEEVDAAAIGSAQAPDPAELELAAEIADQLGETEDEPRGTILRAVQRLGSAAARGLLEETQAIEAQGGLWLGDRSRRRTPGGVFFYLVRQRAEKPDRLAIFYPEHEQIIPLTLDELGALLADAAQWPRVPAQRVRFRLSGRPANIPPLDLPDGTPYVIFNLESGSQHAPPLAKELPPIRGGTTYRVLAATDQWRKIAPLLLQRPDVRIGIIGEAAINPKRPNVITVRATGLKPLVPRAAAEAAESEEAGE